MAYAQQLPSGRWRVRYYDADGNLRSLPGTFATKTQARHNAEALETDRRRGLFVDPARAELPFADWVADWLAVRVVRRTTDAPSRGRIHNHILPTFGHLQLGQITRAQVQAWVKQLSIPPPVGKGLAADTVKSCYNLLSSILRAAVDEDPPLLTRSPCRKITLPPPDARPPVALTPEAAAAILTALPAGTPKTLALTTLGTGLRWGEAAGLKRRNVNLLARTIAVTTQDVLHEVDGDRWFEGPKSPAGVRIVDLPAAVIAALEAHLRLDDGYVLEALLFTGARGVSLSRHRFSARVWRPALRRTGLWPEPWPRDAHGNVLAPVRFQDLRHTYVTWLAEAGIPAHVRMELVGHKREGVHERYTHTLPGMADRVRQALDERLAVALLLDRLIPAVGANAGRR